MLFENNFSFDLNPLNTIPIFLFCDILYWFFLTFSYMYWKQKNLKNMQNRITKTWIGLGDEVFSPFAKVFRREIVVILIIIIQFASIELGIFLSYNKEKISFVVYGIRFSLALSIFCYGHANKACQSYFNRNHSSIYRKRGSKNFWYGLLFFFVPACYLLVLYLRK